MTNGGLPLVIQKQPTAGSRSPTKWHFTGTFPVAALPVSACNLPGAHAAAKEVCRQGKPRLSESKYYSKKYA